MLHMPDQADPLGDLLLGLQRRFGAGSARRELITTPSVAEPSDGLVVWVPRGRGFILFRHPLTGQLGIMGAMEMFGGRIIAIYLDPAGVADADQVAQLLAENFSGLPFDSTWMRETYYGCDDPDVVVRTVVRWS